MKSHDERPEGGSPAPPVAESYEPPALVALGSFSELTRLQIGVTADGGSEGAAAS